jgi:transcriptional regulator with XRE-family HTH domain
MTVMTVGTRLNIIRQKRGLTLAQLAQKANVSVYTLNSWIYRDIHPDIEVLSTVADILDCSLDELAGRTETKADAPITWYDRIKAMPIDEMASFLAYLDARGVLATADRYICRKCKAENGGHCSISDNNKCLYDMGVKDTLKLWLESDGYKGGA